MIFTGKTYDILKAIAQIWLPAAGTLYFTIAQIAHLPAAEEVTGIVVAVDGFLGVILGLSSSAYNNSDNKYDGTLSVQGSYVRLKNIDPQALLTKPDILFKVVQEGLPASDTLKSIPVTDSPATTVQNNTDPRLLS